ncbi:MAG: hypothetical protein AAB453_02335 [Patescibacteria group bacterium]
MTEIIPAIIGKNFGEVRDKIETVGELTNWLHLDIADGKFVADKSWSVPDDLNEIKNRVKIEVHLMTEQPEEMMTDWVSVADRIIVHPESTDHLAEIVDSVKSTPSKLGFALLMNSDLNLVEPYIANLDVIQLMSINELGHHGEPFEEKVLERIKTLRVKYPNVKISVDGGINLATGKKCLDAGASQLVVGSALWQAPDLIDELQKFQNL